MMKFLLALFLAGCARVGEELPETVDMEDPTVVAEWIWTDRQVAWGGWGEQLLALAQREDRPILIYLAAPGCEGLFPAPTSGLNRLIAENFVSVRVDPF